MKTNIPLTSVQFAGELFDALKTFSIWDVFYVEKSNVVKFDFYNDEKEFAYSLIVNRKIFEMKLQDILNIQFEKPEMPVDVDNNSQCYLRKTNTDQLGEK